MTKFRISNHILLIETGRYKYPKIPRHERTCRFCSTGKIENETHVLLECNIFDSLRHNLFNKILNFSQLNLLEKHHQEKLNILLDSKHAGPLASYIFKSFEIIKEKLFSQT